MTLHNDIKGGLILLGAVVGTVFLILFILYLAIYCGRYFPCLACFEGHSLGGTQVDPENVLVARIGGLSKEERRIVLRILFTPVPFRMSGHFVIASGDVENQHNNNDMKNNDTETQQQPQFHPANSQLGKVTSNGAPASHMVMSEEGHDHACAICLQNYTEDESIVVGRSCSHVFHFDCVMEWLEKNDHCPCCRKEMMTADDMRNAAKRILKENSKFM